MVQEMVADMSSWQACFCRVYTRVGVAIMAGTSIEHIFIVSMLPPGACPSISRY